MLTEDYAGLIAGRAKDAGQTYERLTEETSNVPLRKYGSPEEVAVIPEAFHLTLVRLCFASI